MNYIYLIFANADMTEGSGPMALVKVMSDHDKAVDYAMSRLGVMGVKGRQRFCLKPYRVYSPTEGLAHLGTKIVEGDWEVVQVAMSGEDQS